MQSLYEAEFLIQCCCYYLYPVIEAYLQEDSKAYPTSSLFIPIMLIQRRNNFKAQLSSVCEPQRHCMKSLPSSLSITSNNGFAWNHPARGVPTVLYVYAASSSPIFIVSLPFPAAAASAKSCVWQHFSRQTNHHTAASIVCPTVRRPWFWRRAAFLEPREVAI